MILRQWLVNHLTLQVAKNYSFVIIVIMPMFLYTGNKWYTENSRKQMILFMILLWNHYTFHRKQFNLSLFTKLWNINKIHHRIPSIYAYNCYCWRKLLPWCNPNQIWIPKTNHICPYLDRIKKLCLNW